MCCHRGVQGLGSALSPLGVCLGVFFAQPPRCGSKVREITEAVLIAACYNYTPTGGESSVLKVSADMRQSSIHLIGVLFLLHGVPRSSVFRAVQADSLAIPPIPP